MAKKIALGKGIASLIQETPNQILAQSLKEEEKKPSNEENTFLVDIRDIKTNPNQPRKIFKEKDLEELSSSIKENGIIQPLIVMKSDKGFELIAGERRLRASKKIGLEKVPVVIKKVTEKERLVISIIENIQRSDLNCVEEALAYYQLMDEFSLTQEEVAKKLGKERSSIANYLRILKLPRQVIDQLQKELLSFGHAKILAAAKDRETMIRLANEAIANNLTVRELEKLAKSRKATKASETTKEDPYLAKFDQCRKTLEERIGFHFSVASKKNGAGSVTLKFSNEAEFNDIYDYLLNR